MKRFKITLKDGSTAHVTAAGFRREDCIVFYDGDGAEVKTVRARLMAQHSGRGVPALSPLTPRSVITPTSSCPAMRA